MIQISRIESRADYSSNDLFANNIELSMNDELFANDSGPKSSMICSSTMFRRTCTNLFSLNKPWTILRRQVRIF